MTQLTVEIALVGNTLLILYRNMIEGLRNVPPDGAEAARGSGFTRLQTLVRVELPLALPAVMAGLRIATVATVSIGTVAALVIPKAWERRSSPRSSRMSSRPRFSAQAGSRSRSRSAQTG